MKEHAILFSGPMVRAILEGRKTQTRRVIRDQPPTCKGYPHMNPSGEWGIYLDRPNAGPYKHIFSCRYGVPGDRLMLLCTWATERKYDDCKPTKLPRQARIWSHWDGPKPDWCGKSRPGRFMPTRFRDTMPRAEITEVRVQRVQEISINDARAEGTCDLRTPQNEIVKTYLECFRDLWDSINAKRGSWESNPWVWAITFHLVEGNR